jgi:hypothetical protein
MFAASSHHLAYFIVKIVYTLIKKTAGEHSQVFNPKVIGNIHLRIPAPQITSFGHSYHMRKIFPQLFTFLRARIFGIFKP